ncbi:hydroxyacylglutathione hydrolase [Kordiimonas lipolytica]|uniref:Hydroxyacylglutathione hydrolase n=1 Tax=Kordiimonas lipolytica TaxID=1662421 RepID=A0ABV8UCQ1_9PROT|nr:hydroxyacylglutathione hydrolase [Kordiimonas lipolytica]
MLEIVQIPVLSDNYVYLIHEPRSGDTAVVDPAVEDEVVAELEKRGWTLTHILNTHHHWDHTGANLALKERFGVTIVGPAAERERIPGLDIAVGDGDQAYLGDVAADVYDVPGHTAGHIAYHFAGDAALFCGDTLFAMGCGRLFEGTADQMWQSLSKFLKLPDETKVYCAHEYTMANGNFALTVEPGNAYLQARMAEVEKLRAAGTPTIPTTIGLEKATNPFLRPMSDNIQETVGMIGAPLPKVFAEVRARKDNF